MVGTRTLSGTDKAEAVWAFGGGLYVPLWVPQYFSYGYYSYVDFLVSRPPHNMHHALSGVK